MKIIRSGVFETNSSSAHSLVLNKEYKTYEDSYEQWDHIFGTTYKDIWGYYSYYRNTNGKIIYNKRKHEFNFSRGEVRLYDDIIHKTAFLISYYWYKTDDEIIKHILEFVSKRAKIYLSNFKDNHTRNDIEYIKQLISYYVDKGFKRNTKGKYDPDSWICSEFSDTSKLITKIVTNDELLDQFIFNSKSYISISGDEYKSAYLKLVGSELEYQEYYDNKYRESEESFEKRLKEVYPEDKYEVEYHI